MLFENTINEYKVSHYVEILQILFLDFLLFLVFAIINKVDTFLGL